MQRLILDRHPVHYISADCQGHHGASICLTLACITTVHTANHVVFTFWRLLPPSNERDPDTSGSPDPTLNARLRHHDGTCSDATTAAQESCHEESNIINGRSRPRSGNGGLAGNGAPSCAYPIAPPCLPGPVLLHSIQKRGPSHLEPSVQTDGS